VAGVKGGLQGKAAAPPAKRVRPPKRLHSPPDLELIPECAILVQYKDRLSLSVDTRSRARCVQLHQGEQSMGFGLVRREDGEHAAHTKRFVAELRTLPIFTACRNVAFVENEIDDLQHRREPL